MAPAALNCGNYFSYALAEDTGFALLCTGDGFTATDLPTAGPLPIVDLACRAQGR